MLTQIRGILFRSFIIAIVFLFIAYNVYSLAPESILSMVQQFFGVSIIEAKNTILHFYCLVKVISVWVFLVPALSIYWYQLSLNTKQNSKSKKK